MILPNFHHVENVLKYPEIMVTCTHSSTANVSMDRTLFWRGLLVIWFGSCPETCSPPPQDHDKILSRVQKLSSLPHKPPITKNLDLSFLSNLVFGRSPRATCEWVADILLKNLVEFLWSVSAYFMLYFFFDFVLLFPTFHKCPIFPSFPRV